MQVIGLCRFSYPALGGFQVEHETIQDRRAYLYAPDRIESRFRSFEAITLAGIRRQTDPDFTFVILIDDALPDALAARLFDLVEDIPQAQISARAPGPHRKTCQEVLNSARANIKQPCIQFRLDDDDTVAVDFVHRVRQDAALLSDLCAQHKMVTLDYNRGYVLRADQTGLFGAQTILPYYPMGMATVVRGGVRQSIMNFAHSKVAQFMPTVSFTDSHMYIRGHDAYNDSRQKSHVKPAVLPQLEPEDLEKIKSRFGITEAEVQRIFSA